MNKETPFDELFRSVMDAGKTDEEKGIDYVRSQLGSLTEYEIALLYIFLKLEEDLPGLSDGDLFTLQKMAKDLEEAARIEIHRRNLDIETFQAIADADMPEEFKGPLEKWKKKRKQDLEDIGETEGETDEE